MDLHDQITKAQKKVDKLRNSRFSALSHAETKKAKIAIEDVAAKLLIAKAINRLADETS